MNFPSPPVWTELALCAEIGNDDWFPESGSGADFVKAACLRCGVSQQCLDYALSNDERYGIWGGLTYLERSRLRGGNDAA